MALDSNPPTTAGHAGPCMSGVFWEIKSFRRSRPGMIVNESRLCPETDWAVNFLYAYFIWKVCWTAEEPVDHVSPNLLVVTECRSILYVHVSYCCLNHSNSIHLPWAPFGCQNIQVKDKASLNFWLPQDKRIHQWSHHISNLAFWEVGKNRKLYGVDDFFKKSLKSIINWMRVHSVLCKHMTFLRPVFHLCLRDFR